MPKWIELAWNYECDLSLYGNWRGIMFEKWLTYNHLYLCFPYLEKYETNS